MGLILDSSIVIAAERNGDTVDRFIERVILVTGQQDAALSAVGFTEIAHGIYRANSPERRAKREAFLTALLRFLPCIRIHNPRLLWQPGSVGNRKTEA